MLKYFNYNNYKTNIMTCYTSLYIYCVYKMLASYILEIRSFKNTQTLKECNIH